MIFVDLVLARGHRRSANIKQAMDEQLRLGVDNLTRDVSPDTTAAKAVTGTVVWGCPRLATTQNTCKQDVFS